jgi:hypothetical protein
MEFIQSKVYPNLYLVKHPIKDRDSLNNIIKNKILKEMNNQFVKSNNQKTIHFYEYTSAFGFSNGTKHFIENKEDPGGFSSEELINYQDQQIAYFEVKNCSNDSLHYFGILTFFKNGVVYGADQNEIPIFYAHEKDTTKNNKSSAN